MQVDGEDVRQEYMLRVLRVSDLFPIPPTME
jgi:hypothetical protein